MLKHVLLCTHAYACEALWGAPDSLLVATRGVLLARNVSFVCFQGTHSHPGMSPQQRAC